MQEQKAGLTKREKRLLLGSAVVGLFYLAFQFMFLPYYNSYNDKVAVRGDLQMQEIQVRKDLENLANVRQANEDVKARYKELEAIYLLAGRNTDLGRRLTKICDDNNLLVTGYDLKDPTLFRVPRDDGEAPGGNAAFSTVVVSMTVDGEYGAIKQLLDTVDKHDDLRISNFSFTLKDTVSAGPDELPNIAQETVLERVTVTFVVTLLNGLE